MAVQSSESFTKNTSQRQVMPRHSLLNLQALRYDDGRHIVVKTELRGSATCVSKGLCTGAAGVRLPSNLTVLKSSTLLTLICKKWIQSWITMVDLSKHFDIFLPSPNCNKTNQVYVTKLVRFVIKTSLFCDLR
jgi:hypothetical protein